MLFSEPKIPQSGRSCAGAASDGRFSALQRAENSSITESGIILIEEPMFQCSSASRKFLNRSGDYANDPVRPVSVLFSEPKIPQCPNSIIISVAFLVVFQCSSASRKFLNYQTRFPVYKAGSVSVLFSEPKIPQSRRSGCRSSASGVSVLFSEPKIPQSRAPLGCLPWLTVSVLFSEPKIPQSKPQSQSAPSPFVSVLFSEPKIPQWACISAVVTRPTPFQCSSASRKFLNLRDVGMGRGVADSFSALQRAENSSTGSNTVSPFVEIAAFQCSSASRKFLNVPPVARVTLIDAFQCSSASRKFLKPPTTRTSVSTRPFQCSSASRKFLNRLR